MANLALAINKRLMKILKTNRRKIIRSKNDRELKRIALMMYAIRDILDSYSRDFEELSHDADRNREELIYDQEIEDGFSPGPKGPSHHSKRRKKK